MSGLVFEHKIRASKVLLHQSALSGDDGAHKIHGSGTQAARPDVYKIGLPNGQHETWVFSTLLFELKCASY